MVEIAAGIHAYSSISMKLSLVIERFPLRLCDLVIAAGVLLSAVGLAVDHYEYFSGNANIGSFLLIRGYVASLAFVLLVFFILWVDRLVSVWRISRTGSTSKLLNKQPFMRLRQWLSALLAWASTGTASIVLIDYSNTVLLILTGGIFGYAMWQVESALRDRAEG